MFIHRCSVFKFYKLLRNMPPRRHRQEMYSQGFQPEFADKKRFCILRDRNKTQHFTFVSKGSRFP